MPGESVSDFSVNVRQWCQSTNAKADTVLRDIVMELANDIVMNTPVDTGMLRGSWQVGIGTAPEGDIVANDPDGSSTLQAIRNGLSPAKMGDVVYLANNMLYAGMVEFGGWLPPQFTPGMPHKYGRDKVARVRTTNQGYSNQAPAGMVRVAIARVSSAFEEVVAKAIAKMPDLNASDLEGL